MIDLAAHRYRATDPALDFCLWPYDRPQPAGATALRTSALLWHSFAVAGVTERMEPLVQAIRQRFGRFATVWGVKWDGQQLSWEFYFYDYARQDRRRNIADFLDATAEQLISDLTAPDHVPYFMFSVEVDGNTTSLDQVDLYIGNPGSTVSSGICYGWSSQGMELRNFYFFFDALAEGGAIRAKLTESAHMLTEPDDLSPWLWADVQAQTIVVANKRQRDGLYFSRIGADDLLTCLRRLNYPAPICSFLAEHRDALAHHLFDVGWDWEMRGDVPVPVKGSFYGLV
ncbi:hypothetical protein SAMN06273572_102535 [Monaibacterium marinum]|uniref:Uncharacterized protein n=1 Tax=Pontivivens marinum TaxID=1690039 RepID=A0A2C9CRH7_9RHOB|nr:hypothetical protein [Monaibacterium marinum]SOH93857.1 hypothetical protein SAMN06273572_102535 [Monaibacterium marinum]